MQLDFRLLIFGILTLSIFVILLSRDTGSSTVITQESACNTNQPNEFTPASELTAPRLPFFSSSFNELAKVGKKRIVVTRGAGFVGSHLVDSLMDQGHEVVVLDNFYTGSAKNLRQWLSHPNFRLIDWDVQNPIRIDCDQIYHLASPASPIHYQRDPVFTIRTNVLGTVNMLDLAVRTGATILITSTSEVYGDPEVHPQVEEYWGHVNPIGLRSCYDEGKRIAETLMFDYHRQKGVNIRVARLFNTYGPRMSKNDGRVVSNFITQVIDGKPISIYGKGNQTRSFQYISDLVSGLLKLMNTPHVTGPYNLGNPNERTITDLAHIIVETAKKIKTRNRL